MVRTKKDEALKLSIGFKQNVPEGFRWLDGQQVIRNGGKLPYRQETVEEIHSAYFLQRVPQWERGPFADEMWRVLKLEGKATIIVPYYTSMRAYSDWTQEWPPVTELTFCYLNRKWREDQKVHFQLDCNFDFTTGYAAENETKARSLEVQAHWVKHYWNAATDLQVNLVKKA